MESIWLTHAKRLRGIAGVGLRFTEGEYDRERYEEIEAIADAMMAALGNVPVERITGLVADAERDYPTPKADVRGALIEGDTILLVRERSDGRWTLPGGFADVGLSPAANIEKEMFEEAGLRVAADRLYAVRHKAAHGYDPDVRDFYKMFFLCRRLDDLAPTIGIETSEVGFFRLDELPPLSTGRTIYADIEAAFAFTADPGLATLFD